jgi:hypothetical protein
MLLAALAFIGRYGRNVPYYDDWHLVPIVTGDQAVDATWLWSEHNGHRLPLPRLLLVALYRLTGSDFRAGMFFNVLALGGLAALLIKVARELRGGTSYADAFFPLGLLHWGHAEVFLHSFTVNLVLPTLLAGLLLLSVVCPGTRFAPSRAVGAGIGLALLPLCGITGLVYVPPLALWLGYRGLRCWRSPAPGAKRAAEAIWGLSGAALLLAALYFVGLREPERHADPDISLALTTAGQFLAESFGPAGEMFWPWSGLGVLGLVLSGAATLFVSACRRAPAERCRSLGLLALLAGTLCLALSVGLGRPGFGFTPRYAVLAFPGLCWVYFAWGTAGAPPVRQLAQLVLFTIVCFPMAANLEWGRRYGRERRERMDAFLSDLRAGEPISVLLARHARAFFPFPEDGGASYHDWLDYGLQGLHRAGIGTFRSLQTTEPAVREIPLASPTVPSGPAGGKRGSLRARPDALGVQWGLPAPRLIAGVRVTYHTGSGPDRNRSPTRFEVFWRRSDRQEFTPERRYVQYCGSPEEKTVTIWVWDTVDQLRIEPGPQTGVFDLAEVVLLVPTKGEAAGTATTIAATNTSLAIDPCGKGRAFRRELRAGEEKANCRGSRRNGGRWPEPSAGPSGDWCASASGCPFPPGRRNSRVAKRPCARHPGAAWP